MSSVQLYVGLDYHQDSVQVCVLDERGGVRLNRSVANDWRRIRDAVEAVAAPLGGRVCRVGVEACCGSADLAEELVDHAGWDVSLGHPAYVAKLRGSPDKSDFSDGRLVGDLVRVSYLPAVWLPPRHVRELRQLVNYRRRLVDQRRAAKLQVGAVLREQRVRVPKEVAKNRWTRAWVAYARHAAGLSAQARWVVGQTLDEVEHLDKRVAAADARLREATAGDEVVARLMKQEGVGEVTAWVLRAYVGDFTRFRSGKHLARYCGLSPRNASSALKVGDAGLVDGCNKLLRATVVQAAQRLARTSPRWSKLYDALRARGKHACVAVAAVGNRWLRGLYHAMK
ncbi:MAG: IS110 family transposase [Actinobacteria bacterium]|nr:IS110 family transposase [Actinomycetota bacterium]